MNDPWASVEGVPSGGNYGKTLYDGSIGGNMFDKFGVPNDVTMPQDTLETVDPMEQAVSVPDPAPEV